MTDKYPRGKISADDEGETDVAITVKDKTLIIAFPEPMKWIGMSKAQAVGLARLILRRAHEMSDDAG